MLPYLIAGAIGFVVGKLLEEDEAPKYADGGDIDYSNFRTSVIALVNKNKILILQRGSTANWMPNKWSIVGGVIEEGEVPIEAMIRECEEEIGLKPSNVSYDHKIMTNDSGEIYYFVGILESRDVKLDYENSAYKFISKDEIDNYDFVPYIKEFILSIFLRNTNKSNNHFADGGLIAPNGKPSNLTPEQYKLVRLPEFKAWFGDWQNDPANSSKVVDENGEPLVVLHGTNSNYNIFKKSKNKSYANNVFGFFFTTEKWIADSYGKNIGYHFLNLRNPIILNNVDFQIHLNYKTWDDNLKTLKEYKKDKIDGIYYKHNIYVAFEPNQIKLADGSNTTFDSNNPDIRFDEGGKLADNIFDYLIKEKGFSPLGKGFWGKSNCTIKIDFSNVLYQQNGDNRVWVSPIEYSDYKKAFIILEFHCKDKNKGIGTALLKEIIQGADLFGYTIFIEPTSMKKYRVETDINTNDLKEWYSKYDFKPLNDNYSDNVWLRNPNNPDIRFDGGGVSELNNYLHNIRLDEWYMENEIMDDDDNIEQYKADFGRKGSIVFRVYPDETGNINSSIYISSIGRATLDYGIVQGVEGKKDSRGEGAKAIASLFLLYPNVNSFHYEDESYFENEDKSFWKKIGGDSSELFREDFFRYFENKFGYNPDIRYAGGGQLKYKNKGAYANITQINKKEWYLNMIEAEIEGKGYAQKIMNQIIDDAKNKKVKKITLDTSLMNKDYFEYGYGFEEKSFNDDLYRMELNLN